MSNCTDTLINKEAMENIPTTAPVKTASHENRDVYLNEDNTPQKKEFNRINIESLGDKINLVDSDENNSLDMFCYVKCDEDDDELVKQCRGVVFHNKDIVMKAFPYTNEFSHIKPDEINDFLGNFNDWSFYESHEGALIRLFYFGEKWFISTHRKLDAFRSKWSSNESFGTIFKNALLSEEQNNQNFKESLPKGDDILDRFQSTLDTTKQYMFIVRNTKDNRIVCTAPDNSTVLHVGTFVDGILDMNQNVNIPYPRKVTFDNVGELVEFVNKISYFDYQGIIGFTSDNRQVKILNQEYLDLFRVRGNEPSIKFRYLQIRMNHRFTNMLYHLYPQMIYTLNDYENTLYDIARSIHKAYVQRFIKKQYVTVPREEFAIIRECHNLYLSNRVDNHMSIDKVIRVMNLQSPSSLNHMIRRYKLDENRQKVQVPENSKKNYSRNDSSVQSPIVIDINPVTPKELDTQSPVFKLTE
jgi:hypothetical protein